MDRRQNRSVNRAVKLVLAIALIVLGIAGLILPVLQGILFLLIGVLLLADIIPSVAVFQRKLESRNASLARASAIAKRNIDAVFERQWLVLTILGFTLALLVWGVYLLVGR